MRACKHSAWGHVLLWLKQQMCCHCFLQMENLVVWSIFFSQNHLTHPWRDAFYSQVPLMRSLHKPKWCRQLACGITFQRGNKPYKAAICSDDLFYFFQELFLKKSISIFFTENKSLSCWVQEPFWEHFPSLLIRIQTPGTFDLFFGLLVTSVILLALSPLSKSGVDHINMCACIAGQSLHTIKLRVIIGIFWRTTHFSKSRKQGHGFSKGGENWKPEPHLSGLEEA